MVWVGWCSCGFLTMCVMAGDSALVCDTSHLWYVKHVMEAPCIFSSEDTQPIGFGGHRAIRGEEDTVKENLRRLTQGFLLIHGERYELILWAVCP